jgi:hypothetical protein
VKQFCETRTIILSAFCCVCYTCTAFGRSTVTDEIFGDISHHLAVTDLLYAEQKRPIQNILRLIYHLMNKETKLIIHNITAKAALKFGSEAWVLKKREQKRLEAAQMNF